MAESVTVSVTEDGPDAGDAEQTLNIEERLLDKIAEFEGKTEALQSLKDNLYAAIE